MDTNKFFESLSELRLLAKKYPISLEEITKEVEEAREKRYKDKLLKK